MTDRKKLRVMILCGEDTHHTYLISKLCSSQDVVLAIVEKSNGSLKRMVKSRKYKSFCNQLYHRIRRSVCGSTGYRRRYFSLKGLPKASVPLIAVDNINDSIVPNCINSYSPEIIIVMGTGILRKSILAAAENIPIINIHGGCLPEYKGNHCFFFALLNEDYSNIASTIHLIDSGIDSGSLICRVHPVVYKTDNAEKLYCRAEKDAISELDRLITEYGADIAGLAAPQQECGRLYFTKDRTISCEIKMRKVRHRMKEYDSEVIRDRYIEYFARPVI